MDISIKRDWFSADPWKISSEIEKHYGKAGKDTHYVYARNDSDSLSKKEGMGYTMVRLPEKKDSDDKKTKRNENFKSIGTTVRYGANILMCIPQSAWDEREAAKEANLQKILGTNREKQDLNVSAKSIDPRLGVVGKIEVSQGG